MENVPSQRRKSGRPLSFNREAALKQAMLAFWEHGYETTSISALTAAMGITAPSLYTAFGDKKRLFLEAARLYAGSPDDLQHRLDHAPTAKDAARNMLISAAAGFTGKATPRGCLLASATATGSAEAQDVQQAMAALRADIVTRLADRIDCDIKAGNLPATTSAMTLASLVVALIQGMSVLARDGVGREALLTMAMLGMAAWPTAPAAP